MRRMAGRCDDSLLLLHPDLAAAGPAAEAVLAVPRHFQAPQSQGVDDPPRRVVDAVVAAQVAGIVVDGAAAQTLLQAQLAAAEQVVEDLGVVLHRFVQPEPAVLVFQGVVGVRVGGHDALEVGLGDRLHVLLGEHFEEALLRPAGGRRCPPIARRRRGRRNSAPPPGRRGPASARPASTRDERPRNRRGTRASRPAPSWRLSAARGRSLAQSNRFFGDLVWELPYRWSESRVSCSVLSSWPCSTSLRRISTISETCSLRTGHLSTQAWQVAQPQMAAGSTVPPTNLLAMSPFDNRPWTVASPLLRTNSLRSWTTCRGDSLAPLAATGQTRSHRPHSAQA